MAASTGKGGCGAWNMPELGHENGVGVVPGVDGELEREVKGWKVWEWRSEKEEKNGEEWQK